MKKYFKLLLAITVIFTALSFNQKTLAETFVEGSNCPVAPSPGLSSICGSVVSAIPENKTMSDGTVAKVPGKGVPGVSVYLYECDNRFPSCKKNGNIVNPFASTSTNIDGRFHLVMRKLDNSVTLQAVKEIPDAVVQSKRRYLVFMCGKEFAGVQVIPSYMDLTNIVHEVKCPLPSSYKAPPEKFTIPSLKLANQTGYGDPLLDYDTTESGTPIKPGLGTGYVAHLTTQVYWDKDKPLQNMNLNIKLEEADPRFLKHTGDDGIDDANSFKGGGIKVAKSDEINGAWWSLDCLKKYGDAGDPMVQFCMGYVPPVGNITLSKTLRDYGYIKIGDYIFYSKDGLTPEPFSPAMTYTGFIDYFNNNRVPVIEGRLVDGYEKKLYEDPEFLVQNKLPNIPPKNAILFYKELPARQDITAFVQDPTSVASFNSTQYANSLGDVFLRKDFTKLLSMYPACSTLKVTNDKIGGTSGINSYTTGGPGSYLSSLYYLKKEYDENVNKKAPVCKFNPKDAKENPVTIGDVQPPWDLDSSKYKLDNSYWRNEFLVAYGQNNTTAKYNLSYDSRNDSYPTAVNSSAINKFPFRVYTEAGLSNQWAYNAGTSALLSNDAKKPNNSVEAAIYTSGTNSANSWAYSPYTNANRIITGAAEIKASSGRTMSLNKWSEVNGRYFPEIVDVAPKDDGTMFRNIFAGNSDHYPFKDLGGLDPLQNVIKGVTEAFKTAVDTLFKNPQVTNDQAIAYAERAGDVKVFLDSDLLLYQDVEKYNLWEVSTDGSIGKYISTLDEFIAIPGNKDEIILFSKQVERDGTRTPTSAIYMTSAAIRRHDELQKLSTKGVISPDLYDSLLSTLYGNGVLDFVAKKGLIDQVFNFFRKATLEIDILNLFGINSNANNKSFLDRADSENLGTPGSIDDLKTVFALSEATFKKEFILPVIGTLKNGENNVWLFPEDWGGTSNNARECYPWDPLPINGQCKTSTVESKDGISRTCKVDACLKTTTEAWCKCNRDTDNKIYWVTCPKDHNTDSARVIRGDPSKDMCDKENSADLASRLLIAQKQTTCLSSLTDDKGNQVVPTGLDIRAEEYCIKKVAYEGDIKNKYDEMERDDASYCKSSMFTSIDQKQVDTHGDIPTPQGIVSLAGPFACGGTLMKDSELQIESQVLNSPPSQQSSPLDDVKFADNALRMSFQPLSCRNIVISPWALISVNSSIRDPDLPDIAKNKDTVGMGGANGALFRQIFSKYKTDTAPYNPISYHCFGSMLGGGGSWDCTVKNAPEPEAVNIDSLKIKSSCSLNTSLECAEKVFGANYKDTGVQKVYPLCSSKSPTNLMAGKNGFSDTFIKIISAAASRYNIPASTLLAYMQGIGSLQKYNYYWSISGAQSLYDASAAWYGTFNDCDDMNTAAQGPFDWLLTWFNFTLDQVKEAPLSLSELSAGRDKTASRCNFLDAAYIMAANISRGNSKDCANWDWEATQGRLMDVTFGTDRVNTDYAKDTRYSVGSDAEKVFESCRFKPKP
jgi:hypothetical protein